MKSAPWKPSLLLLALILGGGCLHAQEVSAPADPLGHALPQGGVEIASIGSGKPSVAPPAAGEPGAVGPAHHPDSSGFEPANGDWFAELGIPSRPAK